jgi:hypothetical protein
MNTNKDMFEHLEDIPLNEWTKAFSDLSDYLTRKLKGRIRKGPFSKDALGCPAVEYLSKRAYDMLLNRECRWPVGVSLTTQLIRNAKREMERLQRECNEQQQLTKLEVQRQAELDQRVQAEALRMAYRIAERAAADNPRLLSLLSCMRQSSDRRMIARWMHIPLDEVLRLEEELLRRLGA